MKMKYNFIYLSLIISFLAYGCGNSENTANNNVEKTASVKVNIPDFNADSAYAYVAGQLAFGPRVPGSDAHSQCAAWLEGTLRRFSTSLEVQTFKARAYNGEILRGKNIIASFNPENKKRGKETCSSKIFFSRKIRTPLATSLIYVSYSA